MATKDENPYSYKYVVVKWLSFYSQCIKHFQSVFTDLLKFHGFRYNNRFFKASGYIYVTVTFFKSRVSSFFNIFRVAKKFINSIINPRTHLAQTLTL